MAYMRIVRPGMVVGPQQQYMAMNQMKWIEWVGQTAPQNFCADSIRPLETTVTGN